MGNLSVQVEDHGKRQVSVCFLHCCLLFVCLQNEGYGHLCLRPSSHTFLLLSFIFFFLSYSEKFRRSCENTRTFGFGLSPTWAGFPTNVVKTNRWVRNGRLGCDQSGSMDLDHTFKFMNVYTLAGGSEFKGLSTTSDWVDWTLYIDHRCKCEWLFACVCGPLIEEIVQLILQLLVRVKPSKMNTFCNWMSF